MSGLMDDQVRQRFAGLTWAIGITAALVIATLSMVVTLSYQIGTIAGELSVLINHVTLK